MLEAPVELGGTSISKYMSLRFKETGSKYLILPILCQREDVQLLNQYALIVAIKASKCFIFCAPGTWEDLDMPPPSPSQD